MEDDQQFCLRWNNHQSTLIAVFDTLLESGTLVDCTLAAEGKYLNAHKVVLSACSPYFESLLSQNYDKHPIFILKDVKFQELKAMMDYMYRGEVNINQDQLGALLRAAESLQIKGLSDNKKGGGGEESSGGGNSGGGGGGKKGQSHPPPAKSPTPAAGGIPKGLTIEQRRKAELEDGGGGGGGGREGSVSPAGPRRRKRARRRSEDLNHHLDTANSNSSESQQHNAASSASTLPTHPLALKPTTATSSTPVSIKQQPPQSSTTSTPSNNNLSTNSANTNNPLSATSNTNEQQLSDPGESKADILTSTTPRSTRNSGGTGAGQLQQGGGNESNDSHSTTASNSGGLHQVTIKEKVELQPHSELILEPKAEYVEEMNEDSIEDLTLDDDDLSNMEQMDDGSGAGPSHGNMGEGSSQGFGWHMGNQGQDEVFLAAQEAVGAHRDSQDGQTPKFMDCLTCTRTFLSTNRLSRYCSRDCYEKLARFTCKYCHYKSDRKDNLKRHMESKRHKQIYYLAKAQMVVSEVGDKPIEQYFDIE